MVEEVEVGVEKGVARWGRIGVHWEGFGGLWLGISVRAGCCLVSGLVSG